MRKSLWIGLSLLACSSSGAPSLSERYATKLQACKLLSDGVHSIEGNEEFQRTEATCLVHCVEEASCAKLRQALCEDEGDWLNECFAACLEGGAMECADGSGEAYRCNAMEECEDGADEQDCPSSAFFVCDDGERIGATNRCDYFPACNDGSDEQGCEDVPGYFYCKNGNTVFSERAECDGFSDCSDGSDELRCLERGLAFDCNDGSFISTRAVCDGRADCDDGSDEEQGCAELICE